MPRNQYARMDFSRVIPLPLLLVTACSSGDAASLYDDDGASPYPAAATPGDWEGDDDGDWDTLPPEAEDSFYKTEPAASDVFVFVANPDRDTVSKINASTRAVYTLPVGTHPTQVLVGSANPNKALVLNEGDATLSIIDTRTDGIETIGIHPDTNYMSISGDGQYAITLFSDRVESASTEVNGVRSYSNISVVFTGDGSTAVTSTPIAVELNPRSTTFVSHTAQALVLCDDALAQVFLSPTPTSRLIRLTEDIDENLSVAELKVSPDGHYAFIRLQSLPELVVVDLTAEPSEAVSRLPLGGVPSDMDMADESLILVDRGQRMLYVYQSEDPSVEPESLAMPTNQLVGSIALSPDNSRAILYTTLTEDDLDGTAEEGTPLNRFSIWDLATDSIKVRELVKSVKGVTVGMYGGVEVATLVHDGEAGSDIEAFDQEEAFSNYYFDDDLVVPAVLEAPVKSIAQASDGAHEFMILEDNLNVIVVDYISRQTRSVAVQSQPAFVGNLTSTPLGYVSQEHELGRISFIDPESLEVVTITGFELNSQP